MSWENSHNSLNFDARALKLSALDRESNFNYDSSKNVTLKMQEKSSTARFFLHLAIFLTLFCVFSLFIPLFCVFYSYLDAINMQIGMLYPSWFNRHQSIACERGRLLLRQWRLVWPQNIFKMALFYNFTRGQWVNRCKLKPTFNDHHLMYAWYTSTSIFEQGQ